MKRFTELNPEAYKGALVIIDIDGTLTNDRNPEVDTLAKEQLKAFASQTRVYLCSNSDSTARFWQLARETGTTYIGTALRKPDPRILNLIPETDGKRIIVIGDKHLTDGRFAQKIGAEFIRVSRITHTSDRRTVRLAYALDDSYSWTTRGFSRIGPYIELMRPAQWIKNLLVFAPIFFANEVFDANIFIKSVVGFITFSLSASAVYVMNDIVDVQSDRAHPKKCLRPIARDAVPERKALALIGVLAALMMLMFALLPAIMPIVLLYVGLNVLYSFKLKHIAVVDIFLVASFYLLRVVVGGIATGLPLSPWIILCVLFGSLFMIAGKRRAELEHETKRSVLNAYSRGALDAMLHVSAGLAIISYGLYSILGHNSPYLVYSTLFVVFTFYRMLNDIYTDPYDAEAPEKLVLKDRWIFCAFVLWFIYVFLVFYSGAAL